MNEEFEKGVESLLDEMWVEDWTVNINITISDEREVDDCCWKDGCWCREVNADLGLLSETLKELSLNMAIREADWIESLLDKLSPREESLLISLIIENAEDE